MPPYFTATLRPTAPLYAWLLALASMGMLLQGCAGNEQAPAKEPANPPPIFADYRVWAAEGDSMATCMLQFFTDQQKRQSLLLEAPARVQLDQTELEGDSARITGTYYEYQQVLSSFGGRHTILFQSEDKVTFRDTFYFPLFTLAAELPETLAKKDLEIRLAGLPDGSRLRMVLTDTAFAGNEYNEQYLVKAGAIVLSAAHLEQMHSGPIVLYLSAEEDRPLGGKLPGNLSVTYSLTRSFLLE
ncbi:hypothetical protein [Cnuella takakiae]|nr:hypothetical protein [Cnuella takakiae]